MTIDSFLRIAGSVPLLAARPFLTTFVIAMLVRFGPVLPFVAESQIADMMLTTPDWFIHLYTLIALGLLALLEIVSTKSADIQHLLMEFDAIIKSVATFGLHFALIDSNSADILDTLSAVPFLETPVIMSVFITPAAIGPYIIPVMTAVGVWFLATLRKQFLNILLLLDHDNHLGIRTIVSWAEDSWVIFGVVFLIIAPILALLIFGLTILILFLVRKSLDYVDEKQRVYCTQCGTRIYPAATVCFQCGEQNVNPNRVGILGQMTQKPSKGPVVHRQQLIARKRCPSCATRLPKRALQQDCKVCHTKTFDSPTEVNTYLRALRSKLPITLLICFLLGSIPLIGLIPAILYYRLSLIGSLPGYLPTGAGIITRWGIRLLNLLLIALQPVPILGAFVVPLMCLVNYFVYQRAIDREKHRVFGREEVSHPSQGLTAS